MASQNKTSPELHRTFRDLSQEDMADPEQALVFVQMGLPGAVTWKKLLESKRILIVSEAGAGKTYECQTQQKKLWNAGEPAFYFDLAQLAVTDFHDLLSAEEEERFRKWTASQYGVATFFLDSIDELKITLGSFEVALNRFSKRILSQIDRIKVVITTRPIPVDQQLIERYLPIPAAAPDLEDGESFADVAMGGRRDTASVGKESGVTPLRVVTLLPLSEEQIRILAIGRDIKNPDDLLQDIRSRNAVDFARRPQDLLELCSDWMEHKRIRSHREQLENNVRVKLKGRTKRHERLLSDEKALEGASRLALAALLTRKLTIRHSVEADIAGSPEGALDPALILNNWTSEERKALLERALFGHATYGRVRFHHRSVVEFLAAWRIKMHIDSGISIRVARRMLFTETPQGLKVIRPTMRPVAAWLAYSEASVFSEIRNRAPEVLLNDGDPESLSLSQRREALRAFVKAYGMGGNRGIHVPTLQLQRLTSNDLEEEVLALWNAGIENEEVRGLLLDMVGLGKMQKCADIAFKVAVTKREDNDVRISAVEALVGLGDSRVPKIVESLVKKHDQWPELVIRGAIESLFPRHIAPDELCAILRRFRNSDSSIDVLSYSLPSSITEATFTPGYLKNLLLGLSEVVTEGLQWKADWPHLRTKRSRLVPLLASVALRMIRDGRIDQDVFRASAIALRLQREQDGRDETSTELRNILAKLSSLHRREVFWAFDSFNESFHHQPDTWHRLFSTMRYGPIQLDKKLDRGWVLEILQDKDAQKPHRMMMLHLALREFGDEGDLKEKYIGYLREAASDDSDLIALIEEFESPRPLDPQIQRMYEESQKHQQEADERSRVARQTWVSFWSEVASNHSEALRPEKIENTVWNLINVIRGAGRENGYSGWNRSFVEQYFSKDIADQIRIRILPVWRGMRPTLRTERRIEEQGTTPSRWHLGLTALAAEAEDATWAEKLSPSEAELAARYANIEINGFPAWVEDLVKVHPFQVEKTLGPELSAEIAELARPQGFDRLLQSLGRKSTAVVAIFIPRLRAWLSEYAGSLREGEDQASSHYRLERVLEILIEHGDEATRKQIVNLSMEKLSRGRDVGFVYIFLASLMTFEPAAGVDALEHILAPLKPSRDGPALDYFGVLFGDRHARLRVNVKAEGFTSVVLYRLVQLSYRYVRVKDDNRRSGTYTPNRRDDAEDGRNVLLSAILDATGAEAWSVKVSMMSDPLFAHFKDRLELIAKNKAAEEVDGDPWLESEIVNLDKRGEGAPMTRDDMYSLLIDRLDDIDDLLLRDVSPRAAWAKVRDESVMRQLIALQLDTSANKVYTVDQEGVTADEKETDIRLRVPVSGQQATVELKIGERWSGRILRDTIRNQLVLKYMAPVKSRSGCLLVTVAKNKSWKHPDTGAFLDASGLQELLSFEAKRITEESGGDLRVAAKILDLRPRLSRGRKTSGTLRAKGVEIRHAERSIKGVGLQKKPAKVARLIAAPKVKIKGGGVTATRSNSTKQNKGAMKPKVLRQTPPRRARS